MYTRAYDDKLGIVIPESYSGTAFKDEVPGQEAIPTSARTTPIEDERTRNSWEDEHVHTSPDGASEPTGSFWSKLPFKGFLGDIFKNTNFGLQKIGTEEILIIATAAFLLFTKDGDKECGIMLLLLLLLY